MNSCPRLTGIVSRSVEAGSSRPAFILGHVCRVVGRGGVASGHHINLCNLTCGRGISSCHRSPALRLLRTRRHRLTHPLGYCSPFLRGRGVTRGRCSSFSRFLGSVSVIIVVMGRSRVGRG